MEDRRKGTSLHSKSVKCFFKYEVTCDLQSNLIYLKNDEGLTLETSAPFTLRWYNLLYEFVRLSQFIVLQFSTDAAPVSLETIPTILNLLYSNRDMKRENNNSNNNINSFYFITFKTSL